MRKDTVHNTHLSNEYWWGFEQEYFMMNRKTKKPLGWPAIGMAEPQGEYYCGVGTKNVQGREIAEHHLHLCLDAGIDITGTNAEVALGQWEYQIFCKDTMKACDDLWMSRYLLFRVAEEAYVDIELHPKPFEGDWNGSGCHINFSNIEMRDNGTKDMMEGICEQLGKNHEAHMEVYGKDNDKRLTGLHETQHISKFSYGVSDRGASIRIPLATSKNEYKGYLEDRRPASNVDPYQATIMIMNTIKEIKNG
jgi:glutamine synthetase